MAPRLYDCAGCGGRFLRADVVPPRGATRPPGCPWRCRACHRRHLRDTFAASLATKLRSEKPP